MSEAKTWKHGGRTFYVCSKCDRPSLAVDECDRCLGEPIMPGARASEEAERRRLAEVCEGRASYVVPEGMKFYDGIEVNLSPWPDTADNPECEEVPLEMYPPAVEQRLSQLFPPTMPDLRPLHDPRPIPIPDTYGTDVARLEDSLRYWAELELGPPCGHDRDHVVRGYCVQCGWAARNVDRFTSHRSDAKGQVATRAAKRAHDCIRIADALLDKDDG